ncbi:MULTISPECIES: DUF5677 domain-containing protein [unclassified Crossiella]|uniref:DUF5677 domain-containing protein n=1 Tax=unclassified Crossiella TaxID=2620835 RepID=UPI001FFF5A32|nr:MULTISPECIES: DUF5677 domain-containing protein [unclassified Crossiella]MCK2238966.1 DUF5677 domain-containing protein [Crossiella sp. S99.2]MCK2251465.1 DUF5677 domain-containing protein [Crossiella sp. S99.1]
MTANNNPASEPNSEISAEQARAAINTLITAFDSQVNAGQWTVQASREQMFTELFGWWAWINNNSKLVLLAHDNGRGHEAAPNVRSILEHAVFMQWVLDDEDAARAAISAKADDNQRKLFDDAQAQNWTIPDDISRAEPVPQTMLSFAALCARYGAKDSYIAYRMLSAHVHPSAKGTEAYLDLETTRVLRSYVERPAQPDLVLIAICLIQTAQVMDSLTSDRPLAATINEANAHFSHRITPLTRE